MAELKLLKTIREVRDQIKNWRANGDHVGFVPTMGALHEGHLSLVRAAQSRASVCVVSIFVNPTQFAPHEDFDTYPRPLDDDLAKLRALNVDAVYLPSPSEMYPDGFCTQVHVDRLSEGLCSDARPHFFDGVALVVTKLLLQVLPDIAVFGEKDYQQLLIIKRLALDLNIPVQIIGGPTLRESDGLAMSSRNAYLDESERKIAAGLNEELKSAAARLEGSAPVEKTLAAAIANLKAKGFDTIDYFELRDQHTLEPIAEYSGGGRLLAAAWLGKTRLIDNWPVGPARSE